MFTTYILYSPGYDKIYIGFTSDIEQRLLSHNEFSKKGWTIKFRPWVLIYFEEFADKASAMKREKQLKTVQGREFAWLKVKKHFSDNTNNINYPLYYITN